MLIHFISRLSKLAARNTPDDHVASSPSVYVLDPLIPPALGRRWVINALWVTSACENSTLSFNVVEDIQDDESREAPKEFQRFRNIIIQLSSNNRIVYLQSLQCRQAREMRSIDYTGLKMRTFVRESISLQAK